MRTSRSVVGLAAVLAAVLPLGGTAAVGEEPPGTPTAPFMQGVGDLDGDGVGDVVDHRITAPAPDPADPADAADYVVTARRGRDATVLWSAVFDDRTAARPVSLGDHDGIIAVEEAGTSGAGGGGGSDGRSHAEQYALRALTYHVLDADGTVLWSREGEPGAAARVFPTGDGDTAGALYQDLPVDTGLLGRAGDSDLVVMAVLNRTELAGQVQSSVDVQLVDAADGSVVAETTRSAEGARPVARVTGDLDGDGRDDVLVTSHGAGEASGVAALSGVDLSELWHNTGIDVPAFMSLASAGDVDADGVDDLLLEGTDRAVIVTSAGFTDPFDLLLVDGRTGTERFRTLGHAAFRVGDVGGGAGDDIGLVTIEEIGDEAVVWVEALDGQGGSIYAAEYTVPAEGASVDLSGPVGDLDGDGAVESAHRLTSPGQDRSAVVDGRSGQALRPDLVGRPLGARSPGGPASLARLVPNEDGSGTFQVVHGVSGQTVWASSPLPDVTAATSWRSHLHEVSGDGVRDVVLQLDGPAGVPRTVVLDGTSGAALWSR